MDLYRSIMLEIEEGTILFEPMDDEKLVMMQDEERIAALLQADRFTNHLKLLEQAGYVTLRWMMDGTAHVTFVTNQGHDFLDTVRDPKIWAATKEGAKKAGGFSLDLLLALGKGFIKTRIEKATGISIDL